MPDSKNISAYFYTLGCKVNHYDTETMREKLSLLGVVETGDTPQLCIINTCTVTQASDKKCRQLTRKLIRQFPKAKIIIAGCYSELNKEIFEDIPGVDLIVGANSADLIVEKVIQWFDLDSTPQKKFSGIYSFADQVRAFVKVQDGCDQFCSYCRVPLARGNPRSRDFSSIKNEVENLLGEGFQEIVLCGVRLSSWGEDLGESFIDNLQKLAENLNIPRLRLSSVEPRDLDPHIIKELAKIPSLCPHLHLPLQSGSDTILNKMNRSYNISDYTQLVEAFYEIFPNGSITTDIMVGFPGETEEDFNLSCKSAENYKFTKVHRFIFSARPGTAAYEFPGRIPERIRTERAKRLGEIALKVAQQVKNKWIDSEINVLVETISEGIASGYTPEYHRVKFPANENIKNQVIPVKIIKAFPTYLEGIKK